MSCRVPALHSPPSPSQPQGRGLIGLPGSHSWCQRPIPHCPDTSLFSLCPPSAFSQQRKLPFGRPDGGAGSNGNHVPPGAPELNEEEPGKIRCNVCEIPRREGASHGRVLVWNPETWCARRVCQGSGFPLSLSLLKLKGEWGGGKEKGSKRK